MHVTAFAEHAGVMFALGLAAATVGSLAGLGGGFIVAPVLRIFFDRSPDAAASTSLVLVLANVASASVAFLRQGRVDVRLAVLVGAFAVPSSIAGAFVVHLAGTDLFDLLYAAMLLYFALSMVTGGARRVGDRPRRLWWRHERVFTDRAGGTDYRYLESRPIAAAGGLATGFLSSFFGIGGGVLVVPMLLRVFAMPAHVASATSHLVILISAPFGVATHALQGDIPWGDALPLAAGGIAGGQAGAAISKQLSGPAIVRLVAVVLAIAAVSLALQHAVPLLSHRR